MPRPKADIEIEGRVIRTTDRAVLFDTGKTQAWVPTSQISDEAEDDAGATTSIFIPEWLAQDKGLI